MLSKCANPDCSALFLYLHRGKLFMLETANPSGEKHSERKREYFWLCEECSSSMTIAYDGAAGISTRRTLHEAAVAATASS
jgi:hypothetical protein